MMKEYQKCAKELLEFIEKSPTAFQTVANLKEVFAGLGFWELKETEKWETEPGQGYYVTRNDSSLIAFRMPQTDTPKGFHISAAHGDSPAFKVKESPEMAVEAAYLKLNTEKYGGMILSTWLDRPLSVAGRVIVRGKAGMETRLVNIEKDLCVIPNVAIHMNREMNKGVEYNPQTDMLPLYGECGSGKKNSPLLRRVAKAVGAKQEDILGHDLFLYVRDRGRIFGEGGEFVLSPRLDDLQCVYASAKGFAESAPVDYINVCAIFDNEEVGSGTKQGADSTFLEDTLWRIGEGMGLDRGGVLRLIADSFLISG